MQTSYAPYEKLIFSILIILLSMHSLFVAFVGNNALLYIGLIGVASLLSLMYPRVGLLSALVMTILFERFFTLAPFVYGDNAYKLYPLDMILLASYAGAGLFLLKDLGRIHFIAAQWWFVFFLLYVTSLFFVSITVLAPVDTALAFSTWKEYCFYGGLFFLVPLCIRDKGELELFGKILFLSAVSALVFLGIGVLRGGGLWTEYTPLTTTGIRLVAFPHGFYFSLALLGLFLSAPSKWISTRLVMIGGYTLGLGVIVSLMRHLWLGLLITVLGVLMYTVRTEYGKTLRRQFIVLGFPLMIGALVVWFGFSVFPETDIARTSSQAISVVGDRLQSIGNSSDESFAWRTVVWQETLKTFLQTPVIGMGFGQYVPVEIGDYRAFVEVRDIHNSWLALLVQQGLLGASLFLGFLIALLWPLVQTTWHRQSGFIPGVIFLALLCFQALVFLSQPYLETNLLGIWFWVTLGGVVAFRRIFQQV